MKEDCPLGLNCFDYEEWEKDCVNRETCIYWTTAWPLYEIIIFEGLPPIFLHVGGYYEWHKEEYGFVYLNNCDWALYYAAQVKTPFEQWQHAYYRTRHCSAYVRKKDLAVIERVRALIQNKDISTQDDNEDLQNLDDIPF